MSIGIFIISAPAPLAAYRKKGDFKFFIFSNSSILTLMFFYDTHKQGGTDEGWHMVHHIHITSVGVGESSWGDCKWRGGESQWLGQTHMKCDVSLASNHESHGPVLEEQGRCDGWMSWMKRHWMYTFCASKRVQDTGMEMTNDFSVRMWEGDGGTARWKIKQGRGYKYTPSNQQHDLTMFKFLINTFDFTCTPVLTKHHTFK